MSERDDEQPQGPRTPLCCPTCGKVVVMKGTKEDAKAAELECRGSNDQPHPPTLLVVAAEA
jgi:hypothetical protein